MSTQFIGEGNIGSPPEYREFPNGNDDPRRLLRLNVYFRQPRPHQRRRVRGPRRLLGAGGTLAPRRRSLAASLPEGHARAGRRPHGARPLDGQRGSAARDLAGQRAQRRHPAVPHRVRGPQPEATGGRAEATRPPRNRLRRKRRSAGSDPTWRVVAQCFAALHAPRAIPWG
jgi:hypothetical protein